MNCPQMPLLGLREASRLSPVFTATSRNTGLQSPAVTDSLSNPPHVWKETQTAVKVVADTCQGRGISEVLLPL